MNTGIDVRRELFPLLDSVLFTKAAVSKHPGAINAMILQWNKVTPFSVPKNNVR